MTALWDDAFACIGGPTRGVEALAVHPLTGLRRVDPDDEDITPSGAPGD